MISSSINVSSLRGKLRFFKRYSDARSGGSWSVRRDGWDGIRFIPNRDIKVFGMGLFERYPDGGPFKIGYKYKIMDSNNQDVVPYTQVWEEEVNVDRSTITDHIIQHVFVNHPDGILVQARQKLDWSMWFDSSDGRCYNSENGGDYRNIANEDMGLFELENSSNSGNSTTINRGIIPGILYKIA